MQTRRQFLRDCSLAATIAALAPATALAHPGEFPPGAGPWPGFNEFARCLRSHFTVRAGAGTVSLVLADAQAQAVKSAGSEIAGNESFSLLFHGPLASPLPQNTYSFEHPRLGPLSMFITPVGQARTDLRLYEAVFNRPVDPAALASQLARAPKRIQSQLKPV